MYQEEDYRNLQEIRDFLVSEGIPYIEEEGKGIFYLNEKTIELRYVRGYDHPIDNSKRFGETCRGVDKNYFFDISKSNFDNGIRTIWVFDFEMAQCSDLVLLDGETVKGYRRQWEVIKNTICTACGKIKYRIYARDCEVRLVPSKVSREFLSLNCFYGFRSASVTLGLYLKKDKYHFKKGDLMFLYSFGYNFYGNKKHADDPLVEVIRASTRIGCQVIGGISKSIKYFCENYPTMKVGDRNINVNRIVFYVDASHNDARGMTNSNSSFTFKTWKNGGFMNMWTVDHQDKEYPALKGTKGEIFQRKPMFHKRIMQLIGKGKIISIGNAGTIVYEMSREDFLNRKC